MESGCSVPSVLCRSYFQAARLLAAQERSALFNAREIDNAKPLGGLGVIAWTVQPNVPRVLVHPIFLPFFPQGAHAICQLLIRRSHHGNARLPPIA